MSNHGHSHGNGHSHGSPQHVTDTEGRGARVNRVDQTVHTRVQEAQSPTMRGVENIEFHHAQNEFLAHRHFDLMDEGLETGIDNSEFFEEEDVDFANITDDLDMDKAFRAASIWIEAINGESFGDLTFHEALKDGLRLIDLINKIVPGSAKRPHKMKSMFACLENIGKFCDALRTIQFEDTNLFESMDLYEARNLKSVLITIYWLGRYARGINWEGPHLDLSAFGRLKCYRCKKDIVDDQYLANMHTQWHIDCGRCANCSMDIQHGDPWVYVRETGSVYDPGCICDMCSLPFDGQNFREKDGKRLHPHCYDLSYCGVCHVSILGKRFFTIDDINYCPSCVCAQCSVPLYEDKGRNKFGEWNYCDSCTCSNCAEPTRESYNLVGEDKWCRHNCCCVNCDSPLEQRDPFAFKLKNNEKWCPDCLCGRCETTLDRDNCTPFENRNYCIICICPECITPVHQNDLLNIDGRNCHIACCCPACSRPFLGQEKIHLETGDFHSHCLCPECGDPSLPTEQLIQIGNANYHQKCVCPVCHDDFGGREQKKFGESNYHFECLCPECLEPNYPHQNTRTINGLVYHDHCLCPACFGDFKDRNKNEFEGVHYHDECLCPECKLPNYPDEATQLIDGKTYHEKCLCPTCFEPFGDKEKVPFDGLDYHKDCLCQECLQPKKPGENLSTVGDQSYHTDCLCPTCFDPIISQGEIPVVIEGKNYHEHCLCPECLLPVNFDQPLVDIGDRTYHKQCVCSDCGNPFDDRGFTEIPDGRKLCPDCLCASPDCHTPLADGPVFEFDGKKYCPNCVCNKCCSLLDKQNTDTFVNANGRPYCYNCICTNCESPLINRLNYFTKLIDDNLSKLCVDCVCRRCDNLFNQDKAKEISYTYNNFRYCDNCVCTRCTVPLSENTFISKVVDNEFKHFCSLCLCQKCETPLDSTNPIGKFSYCSNCRCSGCSTVLVGTAYFTDENGKYCSNCVCYRCDTPLLPGSEVSIRDTNRYCGDCICVHCSNPLSNEEHYLSDQNENSCKTCICRRCIQPLKIGQEKEYCSDCRCTKCANPLISMGIYEKEEGNFCGDCVCVRCELILSETSTDQFCDSCHCVKCNSTLDYLDVEICDHCFEEKRNAPEELHASERIQSLLAKGALQQIENPDQEKSDHGHSHSGKDHGHSHGSSPNVTPTKITPQKNSPTPNSTTSNSPHTSRNTLSPKSHGHSHSEGDHSHSHGSSPNLTPTKTTPQKNSGTPKSTTNTPPSRNSPQTSRNTASPSSTRNYQRPTGSPQKNSKTKNSCETCSEELLPGAKFCMSCGTPVLSTPTKTTGKTCPSCGESGVQGKFCHACGASQLDTPPSTRRNVSSPSKPVSDTSIEKPSGPDNSSTCRGCGRGFNRNGEVALIDGHYYHPTCFKCSNCKSVVSGSFTMIDDDIWCQNCASGNGNSNTQSPSGHQELIDNEHCSGCHNKFGGFDKKLSAIGSMWHSDCFKCGECGKKFRNRFFQHEGRPYCLEHLPSSN